MHVGEDAAALLDRILEKDDGLHKAHFQIADRCNHTCEHCYQVQGQKGELTTEQAKSVLDRLARDGVFLLTISGGEATLRDDLVDLVRHARALGMAVTLFTNGYSMTPALAGALADAAVWRIHVSLYSADPEVHDAVTKVPGSHARTLAGVRAMRAVGLRVVLKTPLMQRNHDSVARVRELAQELGCSLGLSDEITAREDGELAPVRLNASQDQHAAYLDGEQRTHDYTPASIAAYRRGRTCAIGHIGLTIEPNGEVRPCTALVAPLGNIVRDSPEAISTGEVNRFLQSVTVADLHGCRDCDLIPGCQRCHGNAAHEAGDAFAPYASACARALAAYRRSVGGKLMMLSPQAPLSRDTNIGPFRIEAPGVIRPVPDVRRENDEATARKYPWVRPALDYAKSMVTSPGGETLVQLRRRQTRTNTERGSGE